MTPPTPAKTTPGPQELLPVYQELLPPAVIQELVKASDQRFYERLLPPLVLVWGWLYQRLHSDHTCDAAVSYLSSGAADHLDRRHAQPLSQRIQSESTAAYCKGRKRLPLVVLQGALRHTAQVIRRWRGADGLWLGHPVGLLDGTTHLLRPEPELVAHYGRHQNQHGETYWVVMRTVAVFCLTTGALLGLVDGSWRTSEQALAAQVLALAVADSVYVGDCNFGVFSVAQAARHYGVWVVLRLSQRRARALAGRRLRPGEDLSVQWAPSARDQVHPAMSTAPITGRLIYVRLERDGFRPVEIYLFTTLVDPERYARAAVVELYGWRWHVELDLRYVKDTLDLAWLPSKTVAMVRKDLTAGLLAYNLIRGFMVQAAQRAHCSPLTLSFTRCWRRVCDVLITLGLSAAAPQVRHQIERLVVRLGQCTLPARARFRIEPRAVRRRPATYPNLKGSRAAARQRVLEQLRAPAKC